jgi:hypothetical protein
MSLEYEYANKFIYYFITLSQTMITCITVISKPNSIILTIRQLLSVLKVSYGQLCGILSSNSDYRVNKPLNFIKLLDRWFNNLQINKKKY